MQRIAKTDESHKTITFAVLVPNEVDYNKDIIDANEIIKTAHDFMLNLDDKAVNIDHKPGTEVAAVKIVESYILPQEISFTDGSLPEGTWMVALKFEDEGMYQDALNGEFVGVSMEWKRYND